MHAAVASRRVARDVGGAADDEHRAHAGGPRGEQPRLAVLEDEAVGRRDAERAGAVQVIRRGRACDARTPSPPMRARGSTQSAMPSLPRKESITARGLEETTPSGSRIAASRIASGAPGTGVTSAAMPVQYTSSSSASAAVPPAMPVPARITSATCSQVRPRVSECGREKSGNAVAPATTRIAVSVWISLSTSVPSRSKSAARTGVTREPAGSRAAATRTSASGRSHRRCRARASSQGPSSRCRRSRSSRRRRLRSRGSRSASARAIPR